METLTRTMKLAVYGNPGKMETARYTANRYVKYVQHFCTQLFFYPRKNLSTKNMGGLANRAQHRAQGILRAQRAAVSATGAKTNIPQINFVACPAKVEKSVNSQYDYWVSFEDQFSKKRVKIPAKSHKKLNRFLREGWSLNPVGELVAQKNGRWQVLVHVQKPAPVAARRDKHLGVDVGIAHGVARSDGYLGKTLRPVIRHGAAAQAERQRQNHRKKSVKTSLKQLLDVEVSRALARCKRGELSLAVENPKQLANLRGRGHHRWARCYFANRAVVRAAEEGVWVTHVNPAYTSLSCFACGHTDKQNRVNRAQFKCTACKTVDHADLNAARNIARKGSVVSGGKPPRKSGTVNGGVYV